MFVTDNTNVSNASYTRAKFERNGSIDFISLFLRHLVECSLLRITAAGKKVRKSNSSKGWEAVKARPLNMFPITVNTIG